MQVNHSQKLSEKPLTPWIIAEPSGKIVLTVIVSSVSRDNFKVEESGLFNIPLLEPLLMVW